jgi:hypothetical protein
MNAGAAYAVPHDEMVFALFQSSRNSNRLFVLSSGGTWDPQALPRSQEGVLAHAVLPNQR